MDGWPGGAKRTMTEVAKIIGDAVNNAPCEKCRKKDEQICELEEQVNIGYFDREVCIPELQAELAACRDEIKRMQDYFGDVTVVAKERDALRTEVERLRGAVEWAIGVSTDKDFWIPSAHYGQLPTFNFIKFNTELRRRAGKEG